MNHRIDLIGHRFGAWTVIAYEGGRGCRWVCWCDCGTIRSIAGGQLRCGVSQSCGCRRGDRISALQTQHGHSKVRNGNERSPTYLVWVSLPDRPKCWDTFSAFLQDVGERPGPTFLLCRIDPSQPPSKENCQWRERSNRRIIREIMHRLALASLKRDK